MTTRPSSYKTDWSVLVFGFLAIALGALVGLYVTQAPTITAVIVMVLAIILTVVIILRPEVGLFILVLISVLRLSDIAISFHGYPSIAKPLVGLLALAIVIRWLVLRVIPHGWGRPFWLLLAYGLVGFASLLYASNFTTAYAGVLDYFDDATIALIICLLLQERQQFRSVVWAMLLAGIFLGSISVYQYLTSAFNTNFWGFGQSAVMNIISRVDDYRISGPFPNPNAYAQLMVMMVPLAFDRMMHEQRLFARILGLWALVVTVLTVVFTFSRGGFLALAVVILLTLWRYRPSLLGVLLILALGLALVPLIPSQYANRLSTMSSFLPGQTVDPRGEVSFRGRMNEYSVALLMFADNPVFGVGLKNYPSHYLEYSPLVGIDPRRQERAAHSLYLEILAEQGLIGMAVFLILLGNAVGSLRKARSWFRSQNLLEYSGMVSALAIGFLGYMTSALFISGAYPRTFWVLLGISLALSAVVRNEAEAAHPRGD